MLPSRDTAWQLLLEFTESDGLIKHALAVEAAMRYYARLLGEDEERWGLVGLLHDFDYERWPNPEHDPEEGHPSTGARILEERGFPSDVIYAIKAHADYLELPRDDAMSKALYAVDELAGFIVACALVQPSRNVADVRVSSVKKKLKSKGFARAVSREGIYRGAEEFGIPLDEHIGNVIAALTQHAAELGLDGGEKA